MIKRNDEYKKAFSEMCDCLCEIISNNDDTTVTMDKSFETMWIHNNEFEDEFRFVNFLNNLIISRVQFINKRNGCMTRCVETIKKYADKLGIEKITVQSVLTQEMRNWCFSHNFVPQEHTGVYNGDIFFGDYAFSLK